MSATLPADAGSWRTGNAHRSRDGRGSIVLGPLGLALAVACAIAIVSTKGETWIVVTVVGGLVGLAVLLRPVVGIYLLFGGAILFEQYQITGLTPITGQTRVFVNLSAYTVIPIRLSIADLLALFTLVAWLAQRIRGLVEPMRMGPFGRPMVVFAGALAAGTAIGAARGTGWDPNALFQELRGPGQIFLTYFLAANLVRTRGQVAVLAWEFVAFVAVKALQGILNYQESLGLSLGLDAVTGHEDVVFFDLAIALLLVMAVIGLRTRLMYGLVAVLPLILGAELLTERRVGFIAMGATFAAIALLFFARNPRRGIVLAMLGGIVGAAYLALFWNETGPLGEPVRALRAVVEPSSVSARDLLSGHWREIENRNIEYTVRQLPFTGVGVGQEYLFQQEPPSLGDPKVFYWRNITHNSVLWPWLKAGPIGAFAFWFLVARVLLFGSAAFAVLRDPGVRWIAVLPVALMVIWITFASVEPAFTYTRSLVVVGTVLGLGAAIAGFKPFARREAR